VTLDRTAKTGSIDVVIDAATVSRERRSDRSC